jgi:mRNA turnover protein 4
MPYSKRQRVVSLTKTASKGRVLKTQLIATLRECVDKYSTCFILSVDNMRNQSFKNVRLHWAGSRFFFGKNSVAQVALGKSEAEEYADGLYEVSVRLNGNRALFFTNTEPDAVLKYFGEFREKHFAKSGATATMDFRLEKGLLPHVGFSQEPGMRKLGLPTELKDGKVYLREDVQVCNKGDRLTPEQCTLLKMWGHMTAVFKVNVEAMWQKETGQLSELRDDADGETIAD